MSEENNEARWQEQHLQEFPELLNDPTIGNIKSVADLARVTVDTKALVGRSVRLPGDDATPEEIAKFVEKTRAKVPGLVVLPKDENDEDVKRFWTDLGTPEEVDGYEPPADLAEMPEEFITNLKALAHTSGLTKTQFQKLLTGFGEAQVAVTESQQAQQEEAEAQLRQALGGAYDETLQITDGIADKFEEKDFPVEMSNGLRLMLRNIAKSMSSDPQVFKQINNPDVGKTPAELRLDVDRWREQLMDRSITGTRRKEIMSKYQKAFDELAKYKVA